MCALHYSSGTTGIPKGAQRTHANRLVSLAAMRDRVLAGTLDGAEPAVFLHAGPVIHTSGLFVLPFLEAGGRQVLLDHVGRRV
ncbi:AMP-binding protein [Rhodococcus hoagii]|nr:AMP-binding protein [Prescottella equi]